jgi:hypothetical protein
MPPHWNENRLTAKLGIGYPVIQGPLGGLSSQKLTAAVSNFGGLGSFGAHSLTPEAIKDVIAEIRSLTSKPFAMNLWVSMEDEDARISDENAFNRSLAPLAIHIATLRARIRKRRSPPSSPGFTREKSRVHRADKGLHRKTRAGNPQPLAGGVEPAGNRDPAVSPGASTRQKPGDSGGGGGPIGSPTCCLIGCGRRANCDDVFRPALFQGFLWWDSVAEAEHWNVRVQQHASLIFKSGLLARQEYRSHLHGLCPKNHGGDYAAGIRDTTSCDHRQIDRVGYLGYERKGACK